MFFQNSSSFNENMESAANNIKLADVGLKSIAQTLKTAINPINTLNEIARINQVTSDVVRTSLGQGAAVTEELQKSFAKATYNTLEFGIGLEENVEMFKSLNTQLQRNTLLTSEQISSLSILAKNAGITADQMGNIVKGFDTMGVGVNEAIENVSALEKQARLYGVNVSQFMGTISDNMEKMNAYDFRDGVKGLGNMVAKAQALRMNTDTAFKLSQDFLDPEKAIEFSAEIQALGGAIGGLGDPFQLMYDAQNDVEGLQDKMVGLMESMVDFNEETGEFRVSGQMKRAAKEYSKLFGTTYEETISIAKNAAQRRQKLDILGKSSARFSEDEKEFLSNIAQISKEGGQFGLQVQIDDQLKDIQDLNEKDIERLRNIQEEAAMSDEDIAREQLGYLRDIDGKIAQMGALPITKLIEEGQVNKMFENITSGLGSSIERATGVVEGYSNQYLSTHIDQLINLTNQAAQRGIEEFEKIDFSDLQSVLSLVTEDFQALEGVLGDILGDGGVFNEVIERMSRSTYERESRAAVDRENIDDRGSINTVIDPVQLPINTTTVNEDRYASVTTTSPETVPVNLTVTGNISLDVNNLLTNYDLNVDELGREIINNPAVMSHIASTLTGRNNEYGNGMQTTINVG